MKDTTFERQLEKFLSEKKRIKELEKLKALIDWVGGPQKELTDIGVGEFLNSQKTNNENSH